MRVFCPEHKRGFFAPRQSPIKCENRGHLLGEIDFEGQAKSPVELQWQYCCNCEHFCPIGFDQYGLQRCPVCTRKSSLLYLCDRCHVISFESNTPLQTKNFTLTAEGAPQPSCPGCLSPASADLHEHSCDEINASFVTGLSSCPICKDRLDVAPAFPSLVANYLKRTKSANKVSVTFDYETGSFVPVEDGEFVVVKNVDQSRRAVVLPRAGKFAAKRDFYEYYQDYYHCANPEAGEIQIIQPAYVATSGEGWTLETTGLLEVIQEQPKKRIVPAVVQQPVPPPVQQPVPPVERTEEPEPVVVKQTGPVARPCPDCGAMIEMRYSFCWKCGHSLEEEVATPSPASGRKPGMTVSSAPVDLDDDDELTVHHKGQSLSASMLSWASARTPERPSATKGSVLKLIAIATVALMLVSLGLFGLLRADTPTATATVAQPAASQPSQPAPSATFTTEVSRSAPTETTTTQQVAPAPVNPEDELKKLRERRLAASASERSKVMQAFAKVEKQYPRDYRFPYERAKFAVKVSKSKSRSEAFKALNVAAEKAITTGKASEMLSGLESDKSGDFSELSQGRYEWSRLVAALKRKDTSLLSE